MVAVVGEAVQFACRPTFQPSPKAEQAGPLNASHTETCGLEPRRDLSPRAFYESLLRNTEGTSESQPKGKDLQK